MSSRRVGTAVFSLLLAALVFLPAFPVLAQTPVTPTVFASGFFEPSGTAFSADGTLYVADRGTGTIKKVDTQGNVTPFVSGLFGPAGIAFDRSGNLYVANTFQGAIVRIAPDGTKSTFASGLSLQFFAPLAFDRLGDLFVGVSGKVVRITPAGEKFDFVIGFDTFIGGLAFDGAGNLFISEFFSGRIFRATPDGTLSLFFNLQTPFGFLAGAESLAFDINGNLYVANGLPLDFFSKGVVYKINASGTSAEDLTTRDLAGPSYLAFGVGALTGQLLFSNDGTFHFPPPPLAQTVATASVGVAGLPLLGEPPELSSIRITPASFIFETGGMKTFQAEAVSQDGFSLGPVSVKWGLTNDHPQNVVTAPGLQNSGNWFKNPDGSFYVASSITLEAGQEIGSATLKAQFTRQGGSNLNATAALQVVEDVGEVAFTVSDINPANGQANVKRTATVSATFTKPLNPLSVTGASFFLKDSDGAPISAGISFSADLRTAFLEPSSALPFGETITLTLKGQTPINGGGGQGQGGPQFFGIQDLDGNFLAGDLTSSFTTIFPPGHGGGNPSDGPGGIGNPPGSGGEPTPPPPIHVVAISPPNGGSAGLQSMVRVTFSEAIQPSTVNTSTFKVIGAGQLGGTYSFEDENRTAVFTASLPFSDPVITVQLTSGILGVSGGELIPFTSSFSVIAIEMGIILDTTGSMSQLPLVTQQIAAFANSMVQSGVPGLRIGVVTFGDAFNTVAEEAEFDLDPRPRLNLVNVTQPSGLQALQSFLGTLSPVDGGDGLENDLGALNFAHNSGGLSFTSGSARCFLVITDNNAHTPQTAQFVRSQRTGEIIGIGDPWTPPEPSSLLSTLIGRAPVNVLNRVTGGGFNMANAALLTGGKSRNVNDLFFIPLDQMGFRCNPAEFAVGPDRQPSDDVFIAPFEGAGPSDSPFGFRIRIPSGLTQGLGFVPTLTVRSFFDPQQGPDVRTLSLSPGPGGFHETQVLFLTERGPTGGNVIRGAVGGSLEVRIDGTALLQTVGLEKRGFEILFAATDINDMVTDVLDPSPTVTDSNPFPVVRLQGPSVGNFVVNGNGTATVTISGIVRDAFADIVSSGEADIDRVFILLPDGTVDEAVVQRVPDVPSITRPNAFMGFFEKQVTFQLNRAILEQEISVRTEPNYVGNEGLDSVSFTIKSPKTAVASGIGFFDTRTLSVQFSNGVTSAPDKLDVFIGARDRGTGEITLMETAGNSFVFTGFTEFFGNTTVSIFNFTGLNPAAQDSMTVQLQSDLVGTHTLDMNEVSNGSDDEGWFVSSLTNFLALQTSVVTVTGARNSPMNSVNIMLPRILVPTSASQATFQGRTFNLVSLPGREGKFLDKPVILTRRPPSGGANNVIFDPDNAAKTFQFGAVSPISIEETVVEFVSNQTQQPMEILAVLPAALINGFGDPEGGSNNPQIPTSLEDILNRFSFFVRATDPAEERDTFSMVLRSVDPDLPDEQVIAMQRKQGSVFESEKPVIGIDGRLDANGLALLRDFTVLRDFVVLDLEGAKAGKGAAGGQQGALAVAKADSVKFFKKEGATERQLSLGEIYLRGEDVIVRIVFKEQAGVALPDKIDVTVQVPERDALVLEMPRLQGREYRVEVPGQTIIANLLPAVTPDNPEVNEFSASDLIKDPDDSDDTDSKAVFDHFVTVKKFRDRGHAITKLDEEWDKKPLQVTPTYLQAAGVQPFIWHFPQLNPQGVAGQEQRSQHIQNQADLFYISVHGDHSTGAISVAVLEERDGRTVAVERTEGGKPKWMSPAEIGNHWMEDLDMVIIAGCSVLDAVDRPGDLKRDAVGATGQTPGKAWAGLGPKTLLGYRGRAPVDKGTETGGTLVAREFVRNLNAGQNLVDAWMEANKKFVSGTRGTDSRTATALEILPGNQARVHILESRHERPDRHIPIWDLSITKPQDVKRNSFTVNLQ